MSLKSSQKRRHDDEKEKKSSQDEKTFIWRDYKPGFEINQFGHLRTKSYSYIKNAL